MIVPVAIKKHMCRFFFCFFFKASDRQYQMCAVNGVGGFFSLERVSDAVYSCTEEELSLFHRE